MTRSPAVRPEPALRIYLVRHAQAAWQLERGSDLDSGLTPTGVRQADALAGWLHRGADLAPGRKLDVAALWTSPLRRAQETCAPVAEQLGLVAEEHAELTEAQFHVASFLPTRPTPDAAPLPAPVSARHRAFVGQVEVVWDLLWRAAADRGPVMAITHGGVIKTLVRLIAVSDSFSLKLCNAGITELEWSSGRWNLAAVNIWDHLPVDLRTY